MTLSPEKNGQGRTIQLLSASDGWVTIDPDSSPASTFSKNGALAESFALKGSAASFLIKDGQQPTLSQFKAAYESGDTAGPISISPAPMPRTAVFMEIHRRCPTT